MYTCNICIYIHINLNKIFSTHYRSCVWRRLDRVFKAATTTQSLSECGKLSFFLRAESFLAFRCFFCSAGLRWKLQLNGFCFFSLVKPTDFCSRFWWFQIYLPLNISAPEVLFKCRLLWRNSRYLRSTHRSRFVDSWHGTAVQKTYK